MKKWFYIFVSTLLIACSAMLAVIMVNPAGAKRPYRIELITKSINSSYEFWQVLHAGAEQAAKELGVELSIHGTFSENDINKQIEIVHDMIGTNPDAIVLAALDYDKLNEVCREAYEKGIKILTVDSGISKNISDCYISTNNIKAGMFLAEQLASSINYSGEVAIILHQSVTSSAIERKEGIMRALRNYPDIELVGIFEAGDSIERATFLTQSILQKYPEIKGIAATNQIVSEGACVAIREHPENDISFFAFDSSKSQNLSLEQGTLDGIVVQRPFNMGYLAINAAVDSLNGNLNQKIIDTDFEFVTSQNMHAEEMQKLIFPFWASK